MKRWPIGSPPGDAPASTTTNAGCFADTALAFLSISTSSEAAQRGHMVWPVKTMVALDALSATRRCPSGRDLCRSSECVSDLSVEP